MNTRYAGRESLFSSTRRGGDQTSSGFHHQLQSMEAGVSSFDIDEDIEDLHSSVKRLKNVSRAIQEETSITGKILESLETSMDMAKLTLKQTMKKLDRVSRKTKSNHVLYVLLFGMALFFAVFFWIKVRNALQWIGIL